MVRIKKEVEGVEPYNPPLNFREKMLKLDFNENTLGPSPKVVKTLKEFNFNGLCTYPTYLGLKEKIAEYAKVNPENVVLTNGSDEGIDLALRCFVNKGEEVIIPTPSYKLFYNYSQFSGAKIVKVDYNKDLSFPTAKILGKITKKTKLIVICNPNNPTGTSVPLQDIKKIAKKAKNSIVLVDEAYFEFSGISAISLVQKFSNILILRTFSKAFGLAGLRIGYIIANEKFAEQINKAKSPYNINSLAAKAALSALDDVQYVKQYLQEMRMNKSEFEKYLRKNKIKFYKSRANFILVDFGINACYVKTKLFEKGILIRDFSQNPLLKNCLRITIGTKKQMSLLMKVLDEILAMPLLIFDLDNTLVDVSKSQKKAIKDTFYYFSKKKASDLEIQALKDIGYFNNDWYLTKQLLKNAGFEISFIKIKSIFQKFYLGKNFNGYIQNEKLLISEKLLNKLSKKYRLAIFTGRPRKETEFILKKFNVQDNFSKIICLEDVFPKLKPNPLGLNQILSGFNAKNAFYAGDSAEDILCAKKAGIKSILYLRRSRKLPKLAEKAARISRFGEIFEVIK